MIATLNNRQYQVMSIEQLDGPLAADLAARGWESAFYTLVGKRGSIKLCVKSIKTGDFAEAF